MTGVELIMAALAAGASAGVTNATSGAIADAYAGLKALLSRRPDDLAESARDDDVLAAARHLMTLVDTRYHVDLREARGVQVGDHNTQVNRFD